MKSYKHKAMAAEFEIRFAEGEPDYQKKAAQACFEELDRVEREISRFRPDSDVSRVAALQPRAPCPVGLDFFECFKTSLRVYQDSKGAFDPSFGKMGLLAVQAEDFTVWVKETGVLLDFGAIGKGYGLDVMASLLLEWGFRSFLLQGGESSALGYNADPKASPWSLGLRDVEREALPLPNRALGGSGRLLNGNHILDPRTGKPSTRRKAAWALAPTGAEADAYSTAFMVMEPGDVKDLCALRPGIGALLLEDNGVLLNYGRGF